MRSIKRFVLFVPLLAVGSLPSGTAGCFDPLVGDISFCNKKGKTCSDFGCCGDLECGSDNKCPFGAAVLAPTDTLAVSPAP